ncbi:hypothetical protein J2Z84_004970 [Agrobacterium rubi]|nr:hypothetical protein [Agrobacterium rubi]
MANTWKHDRAKAAIDARIKDVETVTVLDYTRDTSLTSIPTNKAYRVDVFASPYPTRFSRRGGAST